MFISDILLTISVTLLSIGISARIAISQYFKQREYELVSQRYLEGSIDLLASAVDEQLKAYYHNWACATKFLKQFRDSKGVIDPKNFNFSLIELEYSNFNIVAHYRLREIIGSDVIWQVYQFAFACIAGANSAIKDELVPVLKAKEVQGLEEEDRTKLFDISLKEITKRNKEVNKYFELSESLFAIAIIFEDENVSVKQLRKIKERDDIKKILKDLTESFKENLEPDNVSV